jgi:two-component system cell cycle response regulator
MTEFLSILVVEDDPDDIFFLTSTLNKLQAKEIDPQLKVVNTLEAANSALNESSFDLVITDLYLPDSRGLDTFLEIQKRAGAIPIIIVGGSTEDEVVRDAIKLGAQDYLPKADLSVGLLARIIHHAIERHRLHESLKALSFTDELTHVYNRRGFITLLEQQMSVSKRIKKGFFLFIIDLDYLKQINDTYGHLVGDRALMDTAKCLRDSFRQHDIIGRIGGDEFGVIVINASQESGDYLKQQLVEKIKEYNLHVKEPYRLAFSIGRAYFDGVKDITVDELIHIADMSLYYEKRLTHKRT